MLASLSSAEAESKVYYDYNYRVLPAPVSRQRSSESRQGQASSHSRSRPSWLLAPAHRDEYVIDYYDPEEEYANEYDDFYDHAPDNRGRTIHRSRKRKAARNFSSSI